MKKLMIAAAAALCATVSATALESANVVGYSTVDPEAGFKNMTGVAFCNTSGGDLDIQSIICKEGTSTDPGDSNFRMWWYDQTEHKYVYAVYSNDAYADDGEDEGAGTEYQDKYYWVTDDEDVFIYAPLGWKHDEDAPATIVDHEKTFAAGEGFFVQPLAGSAPNVTVAGQVVGFGTTAEYATVDLEVGFKNLVTCPFPAALDIQDIRCFEGTSADPGDSNFRMWWYDQTEHKYIYAVYSNDAYADDGEDEGAGTEYQDKYYWVTDDEDVFIYAPLGWKHDEDAPATIVDHEKAFSVGEGFFIQPLAGSDPKVGFKNPFYVAE